MNIGAILTGQIERFGPDGQLSAYRKKLIEKPVSVTQLGIIDDQQADQKNHGGLEKALLHYSADHYPIWASEYPQLKNLFTQPGAFGENLFSYGLNEDTVFLGDQYRIGNVIVEVSQGRQPCWKLGHYFNQPNMVKAVVDSRRCGWYYRVIEGGEISCGDKVTLLERPFQELSISRVFDALVGFNKNPDLLHSLTQVDQLSASWQARAHRRLSALLKKQ